MFIKKFKDWIVYNIFCLILLISSSGYSQPAASDWPQFRNDTQNTGRSFYRGPNTAAIKWKAYSGGPIYGSVSESLDGDLYIGSADGNFYALRPDGSTLWYFTAEAPIYSSPAVDVNGNIYFASLSGNIYSINAEGELRWQVPTGSIITSSPKIGLDGTIYIGNWAGHFLALNPDGSIKWSINPSILPFGGSSAAIAEDGTIYVGCWDSNLYALQPDGSTNWTYPCDNGISSSPSILEDTSIVFGSLSGSLYKLSKTGELIWVFPTGSSISGSIGLSGENKIFFGTDDGVLYCLDSDGEVQWTFQAGSMIATSPTVDNSGSVFFGTQGGSFYGLDRFGAQLFKLEVGAEILSSLTIVRAYSQSKDTYTKFGSLYFGAYDGILYAISSEENFGSVKISFNSKSKLLHKVNSQSAIAGSLTVFSDANQTGFLEPLYFFENNEKEDLFAWDFWEFNDNKDTYISLANSDLYSPVSVSLEIINPEGGLLTEHNGFLLPHQSCYLSVKELLFSGSETGDLLTERKDSGQKETREGNVQIYYNSGSITGYVAPFNLQSKGGFVYPFAQTTQNEGILQAPRFIVSEDEWDTYIALVNTSEQSPWMIISLYNPDGSLILSDEPFSLQPNQSITFSVQNFLSGNNKNKEQQKHPLVTELGSLKMVYSGSSLGAYLAPFNLISHSGFVYPVPSTTENSGTIYAPYWVISEPDWDSYLALVNAGFENPLNIELTLFYQDGQTAAMSSLLLESNNSQNLSIRDLVWGEKPSILLEPSKKFSSSVEFGHVEIKYEGVAPQGYVLPYSVENETGFLYPLLSSVEPEGSIFAPYWITYGISWDTKVALVNPDLSLECSVQIIFRNQDGSVNRSGELVLQPKQSIMVFAQNLEKTNP